MSYAGEQGPAGGVVVVTGAGSGIGRAAALSFAASGEHVLGVGRRREALDGTAALHPAIETLQADVCEEGAAERIVARALELWGRVDVLVNNAGAFSSMPLPEADRAGISRLFDVNVVAPSLLTRAALPHLKPGSAVINVSSTFGQRPLAGASHYAASKAAVEQLTRSWALELAPAGIRVNAVAPGPTESEVLASSGLPAEVVEEIKADEAARIPLGRRGEPEDVAAWMVQLARGRSGWLTGQVLAVDGGLGLV